MCSFLNLYGILQNLVVLNQKISSYVKHFNEFVVKYHISALLTIPFILSNDPINKTSNKLGGCFCSTTSDLKFSTTESKIFASLVLSIATPHPPSPITLPDPSNKVTNISLFVTLLAGSGSVTIQLI